MGGRGRRGARGTDRGGESEAVECRVRCAGSLCHMETTLTTTPSLSGTRRPRRPCPQSSPLPPRRTQSSPRPQPPFSPNSRSSSVRRTLLLPPPLLPTSTLKACRSARQDTKPPGNASLAPGAAARKQAARHCPRRRRKAQNTSGNPRAPRAPISAKKASRDAATEARYLLLVRHPTLDAGIHRISLTVYIAVTPSAHM